LQQTEWNWSKDKSWSEGKKNKENWIPIFGYFVCWKSFNKKQRYFAILVFLSFSISFFFSFSRNNKE
jgi:hypothetical protein